ncbi:MAG: YheU family protein [Desulfuromonadales bacterium]|nr:MAG: YheU family protein [Desulfuromonadales bacterium]
MTQKKQPDHGEEGVDIPFDRLDPNTLETMIKEFVTREWADLSDFGYTLDDKVGQVMQQLRDKKVKVVFDLRSETGNIVAS